MSRIIALVKTQSFPYERLFEIETRIVDKTIKNVSSILKKSRMTSSKRARVFFAVLWKRKRVRVVGSDTKMSRGSFPCLAVVEIIDSVPQQRVRKEDRAMTLCRSSCTTALFPVFHHAQKVLLSNSGRFGVPFF